MKIVTAGSKEYGIWWHGKVVGCPICCQVVELQEGDQHLPNVEVATNTVAVQCSCCGRMNTLSKPPTEAEALAIYGKFADGFKEGLKESLSRPREGR